MTGKGLKRVILTESDNQIWLQNPHLLSLEDTSNALKIADVETTHKKKFSLPPKDFYNFNKSSTYWLQFSLVDQRTTNKPYRLEFYDFDIDEIEMFWKKGNKLGFKSTTGYSKNFFSREVSHKNVSLNLDFLNKDTTTVYIRVKSDQSNLLKPVIRSYDDFFNYSLTEYLFLGIFYGLFFFIILYNLIYFFILKEKHYLYYVVYALGITIFLMGKNGTGFQYLWTSFPSINPYIDHLGLYLGITGLLLFSSNFLELKQNKPKLFKITFIIIIVQFLFLIFEICVHMFWFDEFIELLIIQFVFALGFTIKKEDPFAFRAYITAFVVLNICFLINYLERLNLIGSNVFTVYSIYIGFFLQYFILSICIAERTRNSLKQRNIAQSELLNFKEKANKELEEKVEERTLQINDQKSIIETKNKHILDSVHYAKNIQEAFLPTPDEINELNLDYFLINMPRDIVSGDFYWVRKTSEDEFIIVIADCTGHGVPGAFMSIIGSTALNTIASENITEPDQILSSLHKKINTTLKQYETKNEDGMDMSIIKVNSLLKTVTFSGAKNPILICQNNKTTRIRGSKHSIGGTQNTKTATFETHTLTYSEENPIRLLMYSDGLIDQFGGESESKYGSKRLVDFMNKSKEVNIKTMGDSIHAEIKAWKGNSPQIDDILVFGLDLK